MSNDKGCDWLDRGFGFKKQTRIFFKKIASGETIIESGGADTTEVNDTHQKNYQNNDDKSLEENLKK